MGRFLLTNCSLCGEPQDKIACCEFSNCDAVFCDDGHTYSESCWNRQKQCAGCGQTGCDCHFDGLFCYECRKVEQEEKEGRTRCLITE